MDSRTMTKSEERGLYLYYLYCFFLAEEPAALEEKGIDGENKVFPLSHRDLSALVSGVPLTEYREKALNENLENLGWITPRVKRHEQIIKTAMELGPVIPVRFCTIYKSRERVLQGLRNHYEELWAFLNFVRGKEEWGVKIYIADEVGKNLLQKASPALQTLDEHISSASAGEKYFYGRRENNFSERKWNSTSRH